MNIRSGSSAGAGRGGFGMAPAIGRMDGQVAQMDQRDRLALAAAFLMTINPKIRQADIKEELGLTSQVEVSRLLERAKNNEWIKSEMRWPDLLPEEIEEIKNLIFPERVQLHKLLNSIGTKRRGEKLLSLHIIPGKLGRAETNDPYRHFSAYASQYISQLLVHSTFCAVAWGRTVERVTEAMEASKHRPDLTFVPVSGEPINYTETASSPSIAAQRLSKKFGSAERLSLRGVSARIPRDMDKHAEIIKKLAEKCHDYRRIFLREKSREPLISKIDMMISGIGDATTSKNDPWYREIEELEAPINLREVAAGNIGGVWLPRDSTNVDHNQSVEGVNRRSLGIQREHLMRCARRARNGTAPGVVVMALEPEKARVVSHAMGMINHLIISHHLARELLELCES